MLGIDQVDLKDKKLLIRVDYNIPLKDGKVVDDNRIKAGLKTLQHCIDHQAKLILCSHLGSPKGQPDPELSLRPAADKLQELIGREVIMAEDCIGEKVQQQVDSLKAGQILLLENLRFHAGEKKNDPDFSKKLATLADVYVNDAFGVAHREHASVVGVTKQMDTCCAGLLLKEEWEFLGKVVRQPEHPVLAISGGAKVSSKLGVLTNLIDKVDRIIIGGAMANTFLKAQGYRVGKSLVEDDLLEDAKNMMDKAREKGVSFYLPVDFITGDDVKANTSNGVYPFQNIPDEDMVLDTGPATHTLFSEVMKDMKTIVWNGPMGAFENPAFSQGSVGLAKMVAAQEALTIVGGGDTDSLIHDCKLEKDFSFISTGGGSFLEFLEGKELPAFKALKECEQK